MICRNSSLQSIQRYRVYTTDDIKGVFQDANVLDTSLKKKFCADSVLHPRPLADFATTDLLSISGSGATRTGKVAGRFFAAVHGIHDDAIIRYFPSGAEQPSFARISDVRDRELSLVATTSIEDVCVGTISNTTGSGSIFQVMVPQILNFGQGGLYTELPEPDISSVDFATSELTVTYQLTEQSTDGNGELSFTTAEVIGAKAGISSVFFEP